MLKYSWHEIILKNLLQQSNVRIQIADSESKGKTFWNTLARNAAKEWGLNA